MTARRRANHYADPLVEAIIVESVRPMSAYAVAKLARQRGTQLATVQVYRCLDRLIAARRIEKIVSLRAHVAKRFETCLHIVCDNCGACKTVPSAPLAKEIDRLGGCIRFAARTFSLEARGTCPDCTLDSGRNVI